MWNTSVIEECYEQKIIWESVWLLISTHYVFSTTPHLDTFIDIISKSLKWITQSLKVSWCIFNHSDIYMIMKSVFGYIIDK